jgi:hypothetical protein
VVDGEVEVVPPGPWETRADFIIEPDLAVPFE